MAWLVPIFCLSRCECYVLACVATILRIMLAGIGGYLLAFSLGLGLMGIYLAAPLHGVVCNAKNSAPGVRLG